MSFIIPGLQPPKIFGLKKEAMPVGLTFFKGGLSLEMTATVKECSRKKKIIHKYKRVIRRFPSEVDPNRCEYEIKKGEIQVLLRKKEEIDWQPYLDAKGLDQLDSSEDSPDEETIEGAAAAIKPQSKGITLDEFASGFDSIYEASSPNAENPGERRVTRVLSTAFTRHGRGDASNMGASSSTESRKKSKSEDFYIVHGDDDDDKDGGANEKDELG